MLYHDEKVKTLVFPPENLCECFQEYDCEMFLPVAQVFRYENEIFYIRIGS